MTGVEFRRPEPGGAVLLAALVARNRQHFSTGEPLRPDTFYSVDGQERWVRDSLDLWTQGTTFRWLVVEDDEVVGTLHLNGVVHGAFQSVNLAYLIDRDRTGRGLATESARFAVHLAFSELGLHRVQGEAQAENVASQRVLEKAGFHRYGLAPAYLFLGGEWRDHVLYQRLNERAL